MPYPPTPSQTASNTPTPSITPSVTPTYSPTGTVCPGFTPTATSTIAATPTQTKTPTQTPSQTATIPVTPSQTGTIAATPTQTQTNTQSPSVCPLDFQVNYICNEATPDSTVIVSGITCGSGQYDINQVLYLTQSGATGGIYIEVASPTVSYFSTANNTWWVCVKDRNNPTNIVCKSITPSCG